MLLKFLSLLTSLITGKTENKHNQNMKSQRPITNKEPWLATLLSLTILPGLGQIYAGKVIRGICFACPFIILTLLSLIASLIPEIDLINFKIYQTIIAILIFISMHIFIAIDAYKCARKRNSEQFESLRKAGGDPWLAILLSSFIPGLGHIYLGKWLWGLLFLLVFVQIKMTLENPFINAIFFVILYYHISIYSLSERKRVKHTILGLYCVISICTSAAFFVVDDLANNYTVSLTSMDGLSELWFAPDRVRVNQFIYKFSDPKRGDVVVFPKEDSPKETEDSSEETVEEKKSICRIVGLPGEQVRIDGHQVYIDGKLFEENDAMLSYSEDAENQMYSIDRLQADSYFVMGDHRYHPDCQKILARDQIIGKAVKRIYQNRKNKPIL